jgi:glucose/arabinose dehydrogenase
MLGAAASWAVDPPQPVPDVAAGFAVAPLATVAAPTALAFGPGDADGPDLYATTLIGAVERIALAWTPIGPIATGTSVFASGFSSPLGLAFDAAGALYVSDSHPGAESGRIDGYIARLAGGVTSVVVDGLPNGRHNTNHLRFGPDGRLYIANGNSTDNGIDGGDPEVRPYSGSILSVDAAEVTASPAVLHWRDASNQPIPVAQIPTHPRNADFNSKVSVLSSGFRNVFGIAFSASGVGYTAMNGADTPPSQDALFRLTSGADYRFPFCYQEGPPGGTGGDVSAAVNPTFPGSDCSGPPTATALLGWHVCTTGLDLPTAGAAGFPEEFRNSVYVGECSAFFVDDLAVKAAGDLASDDPVRASHDTSHKVARVALDANGNAVAVNDFLTGLALATDVLFGPDGAMYVADAAQLYRVAPLPAGTSPAASAAGAAAPTVTVVAAATQFVPAAITIPAGTTVEWLGLVLGHTVDTAATPQDAFAGNPNDFANADGDPDTFRLPLPMNGSASHTFATPGIFHYFCEPHHGAALVGEVAVIL